MNIFVGNLPFDITKNELRQKFSFFGQVLSVIIMNDHCTGSSQMSTYGYVEMLSKYDGKKAINNLNSKTVKGRVINVVEALPLSNIGIVHDTKISIYERKDRVRTSLMRRLE